jgi:TonB family protein
MISGYLVIIIVLSILVVALGAAVVYLLGRRGLALWLAVGGAAVFLLLAASIAGVLLARIRARDRMEHMVVIKSYESEVPRGLTGDTVSSPADEELPKFGEYVYVEELPEAIHREPPVYPDLAREAGVAGTVIVQALVGRDGRVKDTRIGKSIPMLDAAAVAAVRQYLFKPALSNDEPVAVWTAVPVKFTLTATAPMRSRPRAEPAPNRQSTGDEGAPIVVAPPTDEELPKFGEYVYVEELPEIIRREPPVYPDLAREAGVAGTVMVQALAGKDGRVKDTRVVRSIPMLDAAAVAAVRQYVFKPALSNNKPVAVWVAVPVKFSLP